MKKPRLCKNCRHWYGIQLADFEIKHVCGRSTWRAKGDPIVHYQEKDENDGCDKFE